MIEPQNGNEAFLLAWAHETDGNFNEAIRLYNFAIDFYLFKMMWSIANDTVQKAVEARNRCYRAKRAKTAM